MATYRELVLKYRLFMKSYPFERYSIDPVPLAKLDKPLSACRVALITTAGLHTPEQPSFDHSIRGGDVSFREIESSADVSTLLESHKSDAFDHAGVQADRNVAFPLDRFREFEALGVIGTLNRRHFSFMGSITKAQSLIERTAPLAARMLRDDGVDVAFLAPV